MGLIPIPSGTTRKFDIHGPLDDLIKAEEVIEAKDWDTKESINAD